MGLDYRIGDEQFLEIVGFPAMIEPGIEIIERPGVDGSAFWDIGKRGRTCTVRTRCDQQSYAAAVDALDRYRGYVDKDPQNIVMAGVSLDQYDVLYQVLSVEPVAIEGIAGGNGGLNAPSYGWIEADWTLKPVPKT